jgi:hypothetical protein
VIWTWSARVAWALLPFTAGLALADAIDDWSRGTVIVATTFLWAAWLAGAIALFAPRPWGFAVLRVVAPVAVVATALADAPATTRAVGLGAAVVATVLALGAPVARASANALAYGNEDRYPLTVPAMLALGPLPLAVAVVALGLSAGPLLIADGRLALGLPVLVVGLPLAVIAANSIFSLSRRWFVLVPAGVVIVDPLTLADPVLLPREQVAVISFGDGHDVDALDLRLGWSRGSILVLLNEPATFVRRRGRANAALMTAAAVRVAIVDGRWFVGAARSRRLLVDDPKAGLRRDDA